ncbi:hypothetical protein EP331_00750 [bacterium]|nr:MAG: hypothetical protein EP331_00750 [bacterium]
MLRSYFFIPANKPKFISKKEQIAASAFIFDLEDTVLSSEIDDSIENIRQYVEDEKVWIRPNLFKESNLDLTNITQLSKIGFKRYVLPKLQSFDEFELVRRVIKEDCRLIILVEHPSIMNELDKIVAKYINNIFGLGFGSQDYSMYSGMKQTNYHMNFVRFELNKIAVKYNIEFIDTASMNISNAEQFEKECVNAFDFGCSGKFIIHPMQLNSLNKAAYFDDDDIKWAKESFEAIGEQDFDTITAINVGGKVFEKPHIKKLKQIHKYLNKYE